ncbi:MAG: DNA-directed RNA polymerase subunit alpha [Chloroflexi bacterium]|nr:DNA-directed RNA polymerase subunit alpha [Chloroflexota bacterium]
MSITTLPTAPRLQRLESTDRYGRFEVTPLEVGFGVTIGNSLRRVLLASLPGAAITWIRIRGVLHEFTDVPNAKEDVYELVLNVKKIRLRCFADESQTLRLTVQREGPVTAADIQCPSTVEIVNPEQHLLTLASASQELEIEFIVDRGRGYVSADEQPRDHQVDSIGMIPVDSIYSPIVKVNFTVEPTRVESSANYDRLILDVWTDGTITAEEAISQATDILVHHFSLLGGTTTVGIQEPTEYTIAGITVPEQLFDTPIEDLGLPKRNTNPLRRKKILKLGQLLQLSEQELRSINNLGPKLTSEIFDRLALRTSPAGQARDLHDESEE